MRGSKPETSQKIEHRIFIANFSTPRLTLDLKIYNISRFQDCFKNNSVPPRPLIAQKIHLRLQDAHFKLQDFEIPDKFAETRKISGTFPTSTMSSHFVFVFTQSLIYY